MFKVGLQLFSAEGPAAVKSLARFSPGIFLDLKYHDIPNTVAGAVAAAATLPHVRLMNIHTSGGLHMMQAARQALAGRSQPKLLGVTLLTSLSAKDLRLIGIAGSAKTRVVALAKFAKRAGLDGVLASAHEAAAIRRACGPSFLIVVPGVRPAWAATNDQSRIATPSAAIRAGADYIVVGRPINAAKDPRAAAARVLDEIASATRARV